MLSQRLFEAGDLSSAEPVDPDLKLDEIATVVRLAQTFVMDREVERQLGDLGISAWPLRSV